MSDFSIIMVLVMVIAEIWKKKKLDTRLIPLLNILVAVIFASFMLNPLDLLTRIQHGMIIGLTASGFYDVCMTLKKE